MLEWVIHWWTLLPDGASYYLLVALVAGLESLVMVGLLVPGSVLVGLAGFMAAHGQGRLAGIMFGAVGGALLGDTLSYIIGARLGPRLLFSRPFQRRRELLQKGQLLLREHGRKSLFFGRFIGPLRGMMPFLTGTARLAPKPFLVTTLLSCLLWGLVYPGIGFLGAASWRQVERLSGQLSLVVALLLVVTVGKGFWPRLRIFLKEPRPVALSRRTLFLLLLILGALFGGMVLIILCYLRE